MKAAVLESDARYRPPGLECGGEGGQKLQKFHRDGGFAECIRVPTENAIRMGNIDPAEAGRWCAINTLLVGYGGLLTMDLKAGETLLVSGSTGNFGSASILTHWQWVRAK